MLNEYSISNGKASEKIFTTKKAENTTDVTVAVKELISSIKRIILTTSAYHLYRENRLFENQGIIVIP